LHRSRSDIQQPRRQAGPASHPALRDESGAAIVEFALVLPLLCLIIVIILDFGRAFNYWIDTTHLASEGARLAAVDKVPSGSTTLQAYIRSKADTAELRNGGTRWITSPLTVCVTSGPGTAVGDPVEVTVSTEYRWLPMLGLGTTTIHGSATMRREALAKNVTSGGPGCT
jgi:Flp pilus assembly protein TadG